MKYTIELVLAQFPILPEFTFVFQDCVKIICLPKKKYELSVARNGYTEVLYFLKDKNASFNEIVDRRNFISFFYTFNNFQTNKKIPDSTWIRKHIPNNTPKFHHSDK